MYGCLCKSQQCVMRCACQAQHHVSEDHSICLASLHDVLNSMAVLLLPILHAEA